MADVPHMWPNHVTDKQINNIQACIEQNGLTISNINAFMMNGIEDFWYPSWIEPDAARRQLRIEHTKSSLRLAKKLGAMNITTEPGGPLPDGMSRDEAMDQFVAGLNQVLPLAEELGVKLLVEPEPGLLIETTEQFRELAGFY